MTAASICISVGGPQEMPWAAKTSCSCGDLYDSFDGLFRKTGVVEKIELNRSSS